MAAERKQHGDFSKGSVKMLILGQAVPLTLAQLVQLLYNIVDRIYIGHMPGDTNGTALTGLGVCFPVITLVSASVNLISTGAAPVCSMARGKGDRKRAQDIMTTAFTLLLLVGFFSAVLMYAVKRPLLYALGASSVTYGYAEDYLNIYLLGSVFFAIGTGMNTFINLQGYPRMGMLATVIGAVVNLGLDPVFIFVLKLGVKGAAIATVLSQFLGAAVVAGFLSGKNRELSLSKGGIRIHPYVVKPILLLGIPGFIMGATNCVVQAVCNATLSAVGGDIYIGIMTIINSVREMIGLPISGVTSGSQPVLGFNYGAKKYGRVREGIRFTAVCGLCYTLVFWLATMFFPTLFLKIFSSDAQMIALGKKPLVVYFMGFLFMTLQFSGQSTFVALGKAKQAIFFSIFRKIIIVVPLTLLLPKIPALGVMGVFLAEPISNFVGGSASFWCMVLTVYRKLPKENAEGTI